MTLFQCLKEQQSKLWNLMNQLHTSVKFTLQHTTPKKEIPHDHRECERLTSVPYLDTSRSIKGGENILDLYGNQLIGTNIYSLIHAIHIAI